jgi:riboflavin kinase/FMN adenylyltransferase
VRRYRSLDELPADFRAGAVSIGNFDGVHLGHARIIARLIECAQLLGGPSVVFTFDPHPVHLLRPELAPPPLTLVDRKAELLAQLGVDVMIAYPTDLALLALTPEAYFDEIIRRRVRASAVVEGPNFCFGRGRSGNIDVLQQLCQRSSLRLEVVPPVRRADAYISSSRVRQALREGKLEEANSMLTRPYRVRGQVMRGAGRGAAIGFPTANLGAIQTLLPQPGVYAGRAWIDATSWPAAVNVGPNPTFGETSLKVEAHLIGFSGPLYDSTLEVDFHHRLRDIHTFGSVTALKDQLARDVEAVSTRLED